jgi:hypothetical protein
VAPPNTDSPQKIAALTYGRYWHFSAVAACHRKRIGRAKVLEFFGALKPCLTWAMMVRKERFEEAKLLPATV